MEGNNYNILHCKQCFMLFGCMTYPSFFSWHSKRRSPQAKSFVHRYTCLSFFHFCFVLSFGYFLLEGLHSIASSSHDGVRKLGLNKLPNIVTKLYFAYLRPDSNLRYSIDRNYLSVHEWLLPLFSIPQYVEYIMFASSILSIQLHFIIKILFIVAFHFLSFDICVTVFWVKDPLFFQIFVFSITTTFFVLLHTILVSYSIIVSITIIVFICFFPSLFVG